MLEKLHDREISGKDNLTHVADGDLAAQSAADINILNPQRVETDNALTEEESPLFSVV